MHALAVLAKLAPGHVRLIESGQRTNVGVETLAPIADVLGVSLDWLVFGRGEPPTIAAVRTAVAAATSRAA